MGVFGPADTQADVALWICSMSRPSWGRSRPTVRLTEAPARVGLPRVTTKAMDERTPTETATSAAALEEFNGIGVRVVSLLVKQSLVIGFQRRWEGKGVGILQAE